MLHQRLSSGVSRNASYYTPGLGPTVARFGEPLAGGNATVHGVLQRLAFAFEYFSDSAHERRAVAATGRAVELPLARAQQQRL